jgi:hypothetical protein
VPSLKVLDGVEKNSISDFMFGHSYLITFLLCVGFSIELLQTTFQQNFQPATPDPELPLGKEQKKK